MEYSNLKKNCRPPLNGLKSLPSKALKQIVVFLRISVAEKKINRIIADSLEEAIEIVVE